MHIWAFLGRKAEYISLTLGRCYNHCYKNMEDHSSCLKRNSLMEHVSHRLSRGSFMLRITTDCKHIPVTSRNLPKPERGGFQALSSAFPAGWSLTAPYSPSCLFWILSEVLNSPHPGGFFPCRCIPDTKLQTYIPLQGSVTQFLGTETFTRFNNGDLLPP